MKVKIIAFGIAKDIVGNNNFELEIAGNTRLGELKNRLENMYPDFAALKSLKLAVNENYQDDDFELSENDEVVIIPPVSGG